MEIKANIPGRSAGRLLDALTDAIRPFTEKQGLKADQIRLQREDVLLEIAKKARARLAVEHIEPSAISNKFLVPFLERASLEEGATGLTDWWAALLVSAAKSSSAQKPIYVDILSKIVAEDAQFLERLWTAKSKSSQPWLIGSYVHGRLQEELAEAILMQANLDKVEEFEAGMERLLIAWQKSWASRGCMVDRLNYPTSQGRATMSFPPIAEPVDTSVALGLLWRSHLSFNIPTPWIGEYEISGNFLVLSPLGDAFLAACHGTIEQSG